MKRNLLVLVCVLVVFFLGASALRETNVGPGMIVAFDSAVQGKSIHVDRLSLPNGELFMEGGVGLAPGYEPEGMLGGKFMGASNDSREIPEYIEFEWTEWPYPFPEAPADPRENEKWQKEVEILAKTLPRKTLKVRIRDRIPQNMLKMAMVSKRARKYGELTEKTIWIYFIWHDDGIWLRWRLVGPLGTIGEGGDPLPGRGR